MNPLRCWDAFWFRPTSARPLGAFRVIFGPLVLWHLVTCCIDIDLWLTGGGLLQGAEASEVAGPLRYSLLQSLAVADGRAAPSWARRPSSPSG